MGAGALVCKRIWLAIEVLIWKLASLSTRLQPAAGPTQVDPSPVPGGQDYRFTVPGKRENSLGCAVVGPHPNAG